MRSARRWAALLLGLAFLAALPLRAEVPEGAPGPEPTPVPLLDRLEPPVRILVYSGPGPVRFESAEGLLVDEVPAEAVTLPPELEPATAADPGGEGPAWTVRPRGAALDLDGRPYRGDMLIYRDGPLLQVVNRVDLEDYLRGVVPRELLSVQGEAVRAQAILARTYALAHLRSPEARYDMKADSTHQVYGGVAAEDSRSDDAVEATRGLVLAYGGRLASHVVYHSTCGGHTADNEEVFGSEPIPYLRGVECSAPDGAGWCSASPWSHWEAVWSGEQLGKDLGAYLGKPVPPVRSLRVLDRAPSGRVLLLEVGLEGGGTLVLRGDDLRRALRFLDPQGQRRPLPGTRFEVVEGAEGAPPVLRITGAGWGHGVGMCQWGAIGMARAGAGFQEILEHYYPGALVVPYGAEGSATIGKG